ncbi:hypothetical protein [Alistipes sp.]|uniref:hypothetical protein n=1 Tax=Alistipes sp. TaxID=1872444 RepID=UPI003A86D8BA
MNDACRSTFDRLIQYSVTVPLFVPQFSFATTCALGIEQEFTWKRYASQLGTRTSARNFFFGEAETVAPFPIHYSYASDTHETLQQKLYKRQADKDWYRLPPLHTAVQRSSATGGETSFVACYNSEGTGKHPPDR